MAVSSSGNAPDTSSITLERLLTEYAIAGPICRVKTRAEVDFLLSRKLSHLLREDLLPLGYNDTVRVMMDYQTRELHTVVASLAEQNIEVCGWKSFFLP